MTAPPKVLVKVLAVGEPRAPMPAVVLSPAAANEEVAPAVAAMVSRFGLGCGSVLIEHQGGGGGRVVQGGRG